MGQKLTPMMQQYFSIKEKYQDAILLFRLGDFYEMFTEDAKLAARELELTLTSRNKAQGEKIPMAGIPHHAAAPYIAKLIERGYKVAICEQVEEPNQSKGIVKREVLRVITPGTVIDSEMLEDKSNNYLAAISKGEGGFGFATVDISTGEFALTQLTGEKAEEKLIDELARIEPVECLIDSKLNEKQIINYINEYLNPILNEIEERFNYRRAYELLTEHFEVDSLQGFGCEDLDLAVEAGGAILNFLIETQKRTLEHLNHLSTYSTTDYMVLDANTRRNLELVTTIRDQNLVGSLLWVLDQSVTAMGARKLRKWIEQPLLSAPAIRARLEAVAELKGNILEKEGLKEELKGIYDLERLMGKITYGSANGRDLVALKNSLAKLPAVEQILEHFSAPKLNYLRTEMDILEDVYSLIEQAIQEQAPVGVKEGDLIKDGYNQDLDQLRRAMREGKDWLANLERQEKERTGIKSLKVGFNKVHGYYIEITKANLDLVPKNYERKQTLSNSERYITSELKEKEAQILGAEEKGVELEYELFTELRDEVALEIKRIQDTADIIAQLDVLISLAEVAINNDYSRPEVSASDVIEIEGGRHPVVEQMLIEDVFVPNKTYLDCDQDRFLIITGPNMSGKSTYMRQVALITLLAQMGSFVPADRALIGIVDRIFTRVGAADDLTTGQSTFMVEMNEVANILNNATQQSLIILDEVGRGTSTYDGLSIAWAVSEYISNLNQIGAKSLFATHYHELTELEEQLAGVKNYNVAVKEQNEEIAFLHQIVPGRANQSYGIEVAKRAGIPDSVIERAEEILKQLEAEEDSYQQLESQIEEVNEEEVELNSTQLPLFSSVNIEILEELSKIDIMSLTPLEAMNILHKFQQEAKEELNKEVKNYGP